MLCEDKSEQLIGYDLGDSEEMELFLRLLSKDFTSEVAVRVRLVCLLIGKLSDLPDAKYLSSDLKKLNVWFGEDRINEIILQTY
jgi:hypothetical protein